MDYTARLRRRVPLMNRPRADLLLARGEVGLQAEQVVRRADQRADAALLYPEFLQERVRFIRRQVDEIALDLRADHDGLTGQVRLDVLPHLHYVRVRVRCRKIRLLDVARENRGLVGEEEERGGEHTFLGREIDRERRLPGVQRRFDLRKHRVFGDRAFVAALRV